MLCPAHLRAPIAAIYHFARTADDIADEGEISPEERLATLQKYRRALLQAASVPDGNWTAGAWPQVFGPLASSIHEFRLPIALLENLLDAFEQDIKFTRDGIRYENDAALFDYCKRSANPIGRLLLHLYGLDSESNLRQSDSICTALQLINFWQDLGVDIARQRFYLTTQACHAHGVDWDDVTSLKQTDAILSLIADNAHKARELMLQGSGLVHQLPGRAGWELRLVVQGGLRILEKMESMKFMTLQNRPRLAKRDYLLMTWRALWM